MWTLTSLNLREFRVAARSLSLTVALALLLNGALPVLALPPSPSTQPVAKLSGALRAALSSNEFSVWSDPATLRLRVLIQSEGPVSAGLLTAVTLSGGFVVRQFASIDGILADVPKRSLLDLAARTDVDRISA